jgi:hypothetical protein
MKTTGRFPACSIEVRSRLWMLAMVGMVFSLAWPLVGALAHQHIFEHAAEISTTTEISTTAMRNPKATLQPQPRLRSPVAVPVGFHVADLNVPLNSHRIFLYRQIDEFLQHQVRLSAVAHGVRDENVSAADPDEQDDDVQSF